MEINDPNNWNISDPDPGTDLQSILPFGRRALALLARNKTHSVMQGEFVRLFGAIDMLRALDYHFDNFSKISAGLEQYAQTLQCWGAGGPAPSMANNDEQDLLRYAKYEAAAYVCRLGQFFYFLNSDFIRAVVGAQLVMPTIERLLIFRHKFAAHRSVDHPRHDETPEIRVLQAFSLSCSGSLWRRTQTGTLALIFQIRRNLTEVEDFVPHEHHPAVMAEAYGVIARLLA